MKTPVAVLGASGYSGEELIRILLRHPKVNLTCITSRQNDGKTLARIFPCFSGNAVAHRLKFIAPEISAITRLLGNPGQPVVFLALPHGVASEWAIPLVEKGYRVIDLSADFRLKDPLVYREFYGHKHPSPRWLGKAVYGLPEIHRSKIRRSRFIASPGCYPTSILLPLIPLLRSKLIKPQGIVACSLSGVSGAGRKAEETLLFCECNESFRAYGVPKHRHLAEMEQELGAAAGKKVTLQFTPHLIPASRGIHTTLHVRPVEKIRDPEKAVRDCYRKFYRHEPFVRLLDASALPDTKNVTGTNFLDIAFRYDPRTGRILIFSAEDNLVKGAAGQAVQSMNIMCGHPEITGLS